MTASHAARTATADTGRVPPADASILETDGAAAGISVIRGFEPWLVFAIQLGAVVEASRRAATSGLVILSREIDTPCISSFFSNNLEVHEKNGNA